MLLGTVYVMSLGTTHVEEGGSRGSGGGKYEGSCSGEIILVNSYGACFGGRGVGYPLVE